MNKQICSIQSVSGTGAVHLGATFISRFHNKTSQIKVFISNPTWPNHYQIFSQAGFAVAEYLYYSAATKGLDINGMLDSLRTAPEGSVIVLQGCAHNPTGIDPSQEEWEKISDIMRERGHFPFFDCAYQGLSTGDLVQDSWACRYFVERGFECCIAQSFAKNLGLYGERVGAFHYICSPSVDASQIAARISSQLAMIQRAQISNPPAYGAHIASCVLNNEEIFMQWKEDVRTMNDRLKDVRQQIRSQLEARKTPGSWEFLSRQTGMFSYTGLSKPQIRILKTKWHIYMVRCNNPTKICPFPF